MKEKLCIEILTRLPLSSAEDGRNILQLWAERLPTYLPERFGNWEPVDREFQLKETESILRHWRRPFLATRNLPAMESAVWMRKQGLIQHSAWSLSFGAGHFDLATFCGHVSLIVSPRVSARTEAVGPQVAVRLALSVEQA